MAKVINSFYLDFTKICRICLLSSEKMQSLFESDAVKLITELADVEVKQNDSLPKNVCYRCLTILQQSFDLKNKIEKSDETLRKYLLKNDRNIEMKPQISEMGIDNIKTKSNIKKIKNSEMQLALVKLRDSTPSIFFTEQNLLNCHICEKNFGCKGQLTRHLKTHTGIRTHSCQVCGKSYMESGSLRKHFLSKHSNRRKPYDCPECKQGFDLRSTLIRHIRTHTGEKPFGCEVCCKFYPSKSYLNKHKKIHFGTRDKSFICEICSKSFSLKDGLKAHLITHSNDKQHKCKVCGKAFSMKASLVSHVKYIHTKEKDFMCQVCGKAFVTKCELNEHIKRHSGEKKESKHFCVMCNKKLASSTHLKFHLRSVHTGERPYSCNYCTKSFLTAQSLKIHTRYHTGERPYVCNYCSKTFVTNENLKVHERIHTGERPFLCIICNSSFSQSSTLKTHLKIHT